MLENNQLNSEDVSGTPSEMPLSDPPNDQNSSPISSSLTPDFDLRETEHPNFSATNDNVVRPSQDQAVFAQPQTLQYAGFWARFFAMVIDSIILSAIVMLIELLGFQNEIKVATDPTNSSLPIILFIIPTIISYLYYVILTSLLGYTLGKKVFKLRVIHAETECNISWKRATLREIVGKFVSSLVFSLGFIWAAFDQKKQGWHDKIAKTLVIKE